MADLVVSVPRARWREWLSEGSLAGERATGTYGFALGRCERPPVEPGDRIYICAWDRIRGYAPLERLDQDENGYTLIRAGDAVAMTIPGPVRGFPGWKVRWWPRDTEVPFPEWQTENVAAPDQKEKPQPRGAKSVDGEQKPRASTVTTHLFAPVVGLQVEKGGALPPEEYARQLQTALDEIAGTNAISFSLDKKGRHREVYFVRCGTVISAGRWCLRPSKHGGDCSPRWSAA